MGGDGKGGLSGKGLITDPREDTGKSAHKRCAGRGRMQHTRTGKVGSMQPWEGPDVTVEEQEESGSPRVLERQMSAGGAHHSGRGHMVGVHIDQRSE